MRWFLGTTIVLALSACAFPKMPQTRDEFLALTSNLGDVQTHSVNRRFTDVVRSLQPKAMKCFSATVTQSRMQGGIATSTTAMTYYPSFRTVNDARAELTIQHIFTPRTFGPEMPKGGFYTVAVDIERASASSTRLTIYGPKSGWGGWSWGDSYEAIKKWGAGQDTKCPFE